MHNSITFDFPAGPIPGICIIGVFTYSFIRMYVCYVMYIFVYMRLNYFFLEVDYTYDCYIKEGKFI